eukprot:9098180-Alexandrium_andersonii.AAC.1
MVASSRAHTCTRTQPITRHASHNTRMTHMRASLLRGCNGNETAPFHARFAVLHAGVDKRIV